MSPTLGPYDLPGAYTGDAVDMMREIPDGSIHCCITSPPYWGLRSYLEPDDPDKAREIGAEATPDQYVANMVRVFREVRRVLRDDGTCWLNLGDSYATQGVAGPQRDASGGLGGGRDLGTRGEQGSRVSSSGVSRTVPHGLKPKDLCLIPYRVALALQADGWWLRSNIIWAKGLSFCEHYSGSVMPESVRDRPTSAHEAVFLLTKSARYWYDADAVSEPATHAGKVVTLGEKSLSRGQQTGAGHAGHWGNGTADSVTVKATRNKRNVWTIATQPYSGSHYAVMPPALVVPCVKAGCPAGGLVLDPFGGSGTVGEVAESLGRRWLLFDLDARNEALMHKRTAQRSLLGCIR